MSGMTGEDAAGPAARDPAGVSTVLVEHLDGRGRVVMRERIALGDRQRTITIGRSVAADVTLDDDHAAALHARIEITPQGRVLVSDLGSINGVIVAGKRHAQAQALALPDGQVQIGRTRLRLRTTLEMLAPERPDHHLQAASVLAHPGWIALAGGLVVTAQIVYSAWLGAPRDLVANAVPMLGMAAAIVAGWVGFWALLSRVMQGEWRWLRHAAVVLGIGAVYLILDDAFDLSWFALSLPQWSSRGRWLGVVALAGALFLHLSIASSLHARQVVLVACVAPALLALATQWLAGRSRVQDVNHIDAGMRLYPPGLRLRAAGTPEDFFRRASGLKETADRRRKAIALEEEKE